MMTSDEALKVAENYISNEIGTNYKLERRSIKEEDNIFSFSFTSRQQRFRDGVPLIGFNRYILDKRNGRVYNCRSIWKDFREEPCIDAYRKRRKEEERLRTVFPEFYIEGFYQIIITTIKDRSSLLEALDALAMTFIIPEVAGGRIWRVPQPYTREQLSLRVDTDIPIYFNRLCAEQIISFFKSNHHQKFCEFDIKSYELPKQAKYPENASTEDYEPEW